MASIIVATGPQKGDYYPLGHRTNVVGRDEALPIQILDEHISRKHMQIRFNSDKNEYYALDMKSKHGVSINGHKIENETSTDYTPALPPTFGMDTRRDSLLSLSRAFRLCGGTPSLSHLITVRRETPTTFASFHCGKSPLSN